MQNKHYFFFPFLESQLSGRGGGQAGWTKFPTFTENLFWKLPLKITPDFKPWVTQLAFHTFFEALQLLLLLWVSGQLTAIASKTKKPLKNPSNQLCAVLEITPVWMRPAASLGGSFLPSHATTFQSAGRCPSDTAAIDVALSCRCWCKQTGSWEAAIPCIKRSPTGVTEAEPLLPDATRWRRLLFANTFLLRATLASIECALNLFWKISWYCQ